MSGAHTVLRQEVEALEIRIHLNELEHDELVRMLDQKRKWQAYRDSVRDRDDFGRYALQGMARQ